MSETNVLSDLDLAALLCSRVCHDVISPVGAIANGLEMLDDPNLDEDMRGIANDMVRSSARTATAKLKFCRIAYGAAGSAGSVIDMNEAGEVAKAFVGEEKVKLDWQLAGENRPKQEVKLVLNMLLLAMAAIPRGGTVTVVNEGGGFAIRSAGERAKVPEGIAAALAGQIDAASLDARLVQPYYARRLAQSAGLGLSMALEGSDVFTRAG